MRISSAVTWFLWRKAGTWQVKRLLNDLFLGNALEVLDITKQLL